jgi:hypothetical protein
MSFFLFIKKNVYKLQQKSENAYKLLQNHGVNKMFF